MSSRCRVPLRAAAILALAIVGCRRGGDQIVRESKVLMGTVVEITVAHRSPELARAAIREAFGEFRRIDELMGGRAPGGVVFRLNQSRDPVAVPVGRELFGLLRAAAAVSAASDGAFDVTIGPVTRLWEFDRGGRIPDPAALRRNVARVGYRNLRFDDAAASLGFTVAGMGLDLGAIAKGWAVDCAVGKLEARGIRNAIVDAGGDLRLIGAHPGRDTWRIGVQHPRQPGALLATFDLTDAAIVTSGDYERFFMADGLRYHHILDPATGQPARGCQSVTVLAATAAEADACATAAFVLGPAQGIAFLRARPGVRGVIVGADGGLHWTDAALERLARR